MARILIIAYTTFAHDGRVKRHAQALAKRGDLVDVIALSDGEEGPRSGVNVIGVAMPRYRGASRAGYLASYLRFFLQAARRTYQLSRRQPYDLIIACTMPDAVVLCTLPARLFGSRVILDIHDTMPELYEDKFGGRRGALGARILMAIERACACCADRVLAVHELHRRRLIDAGIPPHKIAVVMNTPAPDLFQPRAPVQEHGFSLVCHGTIVRRLGIDVAIRAVSSLRDRIPGLELRVIGAGDYLADAKQLAERLGAQEQIKFEGLVPIEELPARLRGADLGLVPNHASKATNLMLPVKLLEYATLGIPVVSSQLRTVEFYFPPSAVRMVRPGDPDALAVAIEELYHAPAMRRALADRAAQIIGGLSWINQQRDLFATIDALLARGGGATSRGWRRERNRDQSPPASGMALKRDRQAGCRGLHSK